MAAFRLGLMVSTVLALFVVGAPLQWLVVRHAPCSAWRIPRLFCRTMLRLARVHLAVHGEPATGRPVLLAANHVSWVDILALGTVAPFCFLAKREVASWPAISAFAAVYGTVFVDRGRRRSIPAANRGLAAGMLRGRPALFFPEGTTLAGPLPGPFLSSHFAAARDLLAVAPGHRSVMVQPVAISYSSGRAAWIGDDSLFAHLWRVLRTPPLRCSVRFGTPIAFEAGSDRKAVAVAARTAVAALLRRR